MNVRTVILAALSFIVGTVSVGVVHAWSGPSSAPPGGNVAAPINVGTTDQVKNGGLGVNSLAVFGNSLFGGSAGANAYLNFGDTSGSGGYGIRDNAGTLEFKNSGGSWASLQNLVCGWVACTGGSATVGSACSTAGQISYDNASDSVVYCNGTTDTWSALGGSGGAALTRVVYATSGTNVAYTPSAGTSYIEVEIWGGGGGGGRGYGPYGTQYQGGGGGSSGGYAYKQITSPGTMYYTIGSGGAGSTQFQVLGGTGGTTCFGTNATACTSSIMSATGGGGGTNQGISAGDPGVGTGGDVNMTGGGGDSGVDTENIGVAGGAGAAAPRGGGGGKAGKGGCASGSLCNGGNGATPGGAGGGGGNNVGFGGAGANGGILIKEYSASSGGGGGGGSGTTVAFSVSKGGTDQVVSTNVITKLTWPTEVFDTNGNFANDRFTPSVAGKYFINASLYCNSAATWCQVYIYKNGVNIASNFDRTSVDTSVQASTIVDMNGSTDYIEVYARNGGSTSISGDTTLTQFTGAKFY